MRVISGERRGAKLFEIEGEGIRPTTDRIKENIFNLLMPLAPQTVLDLFAGTGAMGIESISRGALKGVFVDQSEASLTVCRQNLDKLGMLDRAVLIRKSFDVYLNEISGDAYDLIFLDPPYHKGHADKALFLIAKNNLLSKKGFIVVECSNQEEIEMHGFRLWKERNYGKIKILILAHDEMEKEVVGR